MGVAARRRLLVGPLCLISTGCHLVAAFAPEPLAGERDSAPSPQTDIRVGPVGDGQAPDAGLPASYWDPSFGKRLKLTFDNSQQTSDLDEFPLLVLLQAPYFDHAAARPDGADLRFVDAGAAPGAPTLAYEIEQWNVAGQSVVWVKVPRMDALSNSDHIWLYYGNPGATAQPQAAQVWSQRYQGVWHLSAIGASTPDSSAQGNHGNPGGTLGASSLVAGQVGRALAFAGTQDHVVVPDAPSLRGAAAWTFSCWVYAQSNAPNDTFTAVRKNTNSYLLEPGDGGQDQWEFAAKMANGNYRRASTGAPLPIRSWLNLVGTYDGNRLHLYVNGQHVSQSEVTSGAIASQAGDLYFGSDPPVGETFQGIIDEVRVADVARSPDWIAAQHRSMTGSLVTFSAP